MATVIDDLHQRNLFPIDTAELPASSLQSGLKSGRADLRGAELALLTQQLARLLSARLPMDRALTIVRGLTRRRKTRLVLDDVLASIRDGASLADAFGGGKGAFPPSLVAMVRAGEVGGALPNVLASASGLLARAEAMHQRVVSALIYPSILIVLAAVSTSIALLLVLPQFETMFADADARLPALTVVVLSISHLLRSYGWAAALLLVGLALAWRRLLRRPTARLLRDHVALGLPALGPLVLKFELSRFSRTLGVLLANGVPATRAFGLAAATVGNTKLGAAIDDVSQQIKQGEQMSDALARHGRFPSTAIQMVRLGEETGQLYAMLAELAEIYDQDVQRGLDRFIAILVPTITVVMGGFIAVIIAAIMTAMISINDLAT